MILTLGLGNTILRGQHFSESKRERKKKKMHDLGDNPKLSITAPFVFTIAEMEVTILLRKWEKGVWGATVY